jgi:hypothetical protein
MQPAPASALDAILPAPHFRERHHRDVHGSPQQAYAATRAFTLAEMPLARVLFAARGLTRRREGLVHRSADPLLDQMLAGGFTALVDEPGREFVAVAIGRPWRPRGGPVLAIPGAEAFVRFDEPGFVKMAMDFRYEPRGAGTRVVTETRVLATDRAARRAFALYWLPVRLGSGAIRRAMLRAIARRTARARATGEAPGR